MSDYSDGAAYFPLEFKVSALQEKIKSLESQIQYLNKFIKEVKNYVDAEDFLDYDRFVAMLNDFEIQI